MDRRQQLREVIRHRAQSEVEIPTKQVVRFYNDHFTVYTFRKSGVRKLKGYEKVGDELEEEVHHSTLEEKYSDSTRKILARLKRILNCNKFDLFVTWTVKEDRYNYPRIKKALTSWLNSQQKRYGKFEYCIVAELHKDGALHFHGLLKGYNGSLAPAYHSDTNKRIIFKGRKAFNLRGYKGGWSTAFEIDDTAKDRRDTQRYLTKYITKDIYGEKFKKRYWTSKGLNKPHTEYDIDLSFLQEEPFYSYPTEFGTLEFFKYPKGMKRFRYE